MAPIFSLHMNFGMDLVSNLRRLFCMMFWEVSIKSKKRGVLAPFEPLCGQALRAYPGGAAGQFGQDKTEW